VGTRGDEKTDVGCRVATRILSFRSTRQRSVALEELEQTAHSSHAVSDHFELEDQNMLQNIGREIEIELTIWITFFLYGCRPINSRSFTV